MIDLFPQRLGRLRKHHFQGRPHVGFNQMAAVSRTVFLTDDEMSVHHWLPVLKRYIADER